MFSCPIPDCAKLFKWKKARDRHVRTLHQPSTYRCTEPYCGKTFNRRDLRDRHVSEKHDRESHLVHCTVCGKDVLDRALEGHYRSRGHLAAEKAADEAVCKDLKITHDLETSVWPQSEDLIDPPILTTWLWVKVINSEVVSEARNWDRIVPSDQPYLPSYDILQLECLALRVLARYFEVWDHVPTHQLLLSVANMATVAGMIGGWAYTRPHRRTLIRLRTMRTLASEVISADTSIVSLLPSNILSWYNVQQELRTSNITETMAIIDSVSEGKYLYSTNDEYMPAVEREG